MRVQPFKHLDRLLIYVYVIGICLFVLAPILIVVIASFQHARYLAFPIERFSLRWYTEALVRPEWRDALWTSFTLALQTTVIATTAGILAGLALHQHEFRGKQFLTVFFLSPLLFPQLLTGLALLFYFAQMELSGQYISLLLGHSLVALPFVIRLVLAALPSVPRTLEEAAMTLGANEFTSMVQVTLPIIGPAIRGGAVFAFMASYNNAEISLFLATPRVVPLPIKILEQLEWVADPTIAAVATIFLTLTFILMIVLEKTVKLELVPGVQKEA